MLRVRIDGGQLSTEQLRVIGGVSTRYARDTADLTDRQNIQLHWIRIEDVPEIWAELEAVGLSTAEACGDTPRVILGSPVAGIAEDEIIDGTPAIEEIKRRFHRQRRVLQPAAQVQDRHLRFPRQDVAHEINDIAFIGVVHPELGPGFDVWVGGGLSTNPMLGQRLGVFATLDEVPEIWAGVISIFRDFGYRRLRNRARLKFLVADWGVAKFREVLETRVPEADADRRPGTGALRRGPRTTSACTGRQDGNFYVGVDPHGRPGVGIGAHGHRGPGRGHGSPARAGDHRSGTDHAGRGSGSGGGRFRGPRGARFVGAALVRSGDT